MGSGLYASGQLLVYADIPGLQSGLGRYPKFTKQYVNLADEMKKAFSEFVREVQDRAFPTSEHHYELPPELDSEFESLVQMLWNRRNKPGSVEAEP